jgi:purine-binding chemotaxis protein CheW
VDGHDGRQRTTRPQISKGEIDWESIRQRVASAGATLQESGETAPEVLEQAWARRAERLAQVPVEADTSEQIELAPLRLGREVYGLEVEYVFDVRPVERITRVPRTPDWVAGVVNLRGRILSVVDLRRFLGLPNSPEAERDGEIGAARYLVVVATPEMELALLADEVLPIMTAPVSRIQDASGTVREISPLYLRGIVERHGSDSMVILNLPALLADKQIIVHEDIA